MLSCCCSHHHRELPSKLCTATCCTASRPGTEEELSQRGSSNAACVLGQKALLARMDQQRMPSRRMCSRASGKQRQRLRPSENSYRQQQWRHRSVLLNLLSKASVCVNALCRLIAAEIGTVAS